MIDIASALVTLVAQHRGVVVVHQDGGWFGGFWSIFFLAQLVLAIVAIIDCVNKCKPDDRLIWILIIIFVPLGGILYFAIAPRGVARQTSDDLLNRARNLKSRYQSQRNSRLPPRR